jgi:hypothetical protein
MTNLGETIIGTSNVFEGQCLYSCFPSPKPVFREPDGVVVDEFGAVLAEPYSVVGRSPRFLGERLIVAGASRSCGGDVRGNANIKAALGMNLGTARRSVAPGTTQGCAQRKNPLDLGRELVPRRWCGA